MMTQDEMLGKKISFQWAGKNVIAEIVGDDGCFRVWVKPLSATYKSGGRNADLRGDLGRKISLFISTLNFVE